MSRGKPFRLELRHIPIKQTAGTVTASEDDNIVSTVVTRTKSTGAVVLTNRTGYFTFRYPSQAVHAFRKALKRDDLLHGFVTLESTWSC